MEEKQERWFINWFDSDYYHLLYKNRDYSEAEFFINNLNEYLDLKKSWKILDLACGKGRHSRQLNELGYNVTGLDLSKESITAAKFHENEDLQFEIADMREIPYSNYFNAVFNLFTSFGYFEKDGDNVKVVESVSEALKKDGYFIMDYLNVKKVEQQLPVKSEIIRGHLKFQIQKKINGQFIVKEITLEDNGEIYHFKEYVKRFTLLDFRLIFNSCGFKILDTFGDYNLNEFDEDKSDRLILIGKKR